MNLDTHSVTERELKANSKSPQTLTAALAAIRITDVWESLGGSPLRNNRGRAFWRDGDGFTVSLNDQKGAWHDFRDSIGGGVLDLVQMALSCDRRAAVAWLAAAFHLDIDQQKPLSVEDRRRYARARSEAERFLDWRTVSIAGIRERRNVYLDRYHRTLRLIVTRSLNQPMGAVWADACELYERRSQEIEQQLDAFISAPFEQQIPEFRRPS